MASQKLTSLKIPPHNLEAEMALLGSIMIRPDTIHEIIDVIKDSCFYSEKHKIIWKAMFDLYNRNEPIDLLSVASRLKEKDELKKVGGNAYLTNLVNSVPSSSNIKHYADMVWKKSVMRDLILASEEVNALGYDETGELEYLLDEAEKKLFSVTSLSGNEKVVALKDALGEAWERLDHLHKSKDELRGVPTGFKELDNKLSGFQKADLVILAARPSMGKTSLALDIARNAAIRHDIPTAIFSLEMSTQQLVDRMLAAESRVDAWKLRTGKLSVEEEFTKIRDSLEPLSKAPIYVDDQPGLNIIKMRSMARRLKSEKDLKLVIVDYLQLMLPTQTRASDSTVQQVTEISRSLKHLARELNVPVLALSQLSRAVEQRGGRPRLADLRDSGSIEQDADVVMFIHREDKYKEDSDKPNIAEILIEKHRNGPTGKVELYFDDKKSTFLSVDQSGYGDHAKEVDSF